MIPAVSETNRLEPGGPSNKTEVTREMIENPAKHSWIPLLVAAIRFSQGSCSLITKHVELSQSGECPQAEKYQRVYVDGYFGVDPETGVTVDAGYEGNHPYAKFSFSGERGSKSKFRAGVV